MLRNTSDKTIVLDSEALVLPGDLAHDSREIVIRRGVDEVLFRSGGFDRGIRLVDGSGRVLDLRADPGTIYNPDLYEYAFLGTVLFDDGGRTVAADAVWGITPDLSLMPTAGSAGFSGYADGAGDLSDVPFATYPQRPTRDFIMANGQAIANVDFGTGLLRIDITDMEVFNPDTGEQLPSTALMPEGFIIDARSVGTSIIGDAIDIVNGAGAVAEMTGSDAVDRVDGRFYGYDSDLTNLSSGGPDELGGVAISTGSDGQLWLRFIAD